MCRVLWPKEILEKITSGSLRPDTIKPKTGIEIAQLKDSWTKDPSWDIEDTEGFEMYREALAEFRFYWQTRMGMHNEIEDARKGIEIIQKTLRDLEAKKKILVDAYHFIVEMGEPKISYGDDEV